MRRFPPERIVCLTEETVETLYLLGQGDRIVVVSGYAVRPPRVRREKPRASALTSADIPKILALEPDLVFAFSDLQADIVADLVRAGVAVHAARRRTGRRCRRRRRWRDRPCGEPTTAPVARSRSRAGNKEAPDVFPSRACHVWCTSRAPAVSGF